MRDVRKPDFGHAGQIELRVAIANSLRSPHTEKLAFPPDPRRQDDTGGDTLRMGCADLIERDLRLGFEPDIRREPRHRTQNALGWLARKDPYQRPFVGQRITKLPDQRAQRIPSNFMTQ
jgi:hypothetical protein